MAVTHKLEMRQGQQLAMTPQLQQAIRLLQYSNIELNAFVESELERNPLLERDEAEGPDPDRSIDTYAEAAAPPAADTGGESDLDFTRSTGAAEGSLDTDLANVYPDTAPSELSAGSGASDSLSNWSSLSNRSGSFENDDSNIEAYVASERSLRDHLSEQLQMAIQDPVGRLIGQNLIDLVDDAGYLHADLEQVAERLGAPLTLVDQVLARLQTFDPVGVMARSLSECLALQLKDQNRFDPVIALFLDNLSLVAQHNLPALKKAVGVDMDELADMISEIKRLNPKPGLEFGSVQVQTVVPDVLVRAASDGSWILELNADTLPRVLVNRSYLAKVSRTAEAAKDRTYLNECLQTANWLVKSLDQRARTILKVSEEIVRQQDAFFTHGVQYLRPLNLKTVADAITMHESTVSRVTSNKYMATPRGIFELKYFFTSAIASADDGEAHSSEAVRHRIKQMIDAESSRSVLSDDKIVEKLKDDGIDIARRTVAKYREAMRIPSSVQRRREKKLDARMQSAN
jgi:RNA polymerase sigma-54 factor